MENISNLIVTAVAIIGALTAAIIGGLAVWTFRDIRSRSRDFLVQILATVMVAVIPIAGILVYFMLRPRETLAEAYVRALEEESLLASIEHQEFCPACGRRVDPDMVFCPACHTKLRNPCPNCHRAVHLSWDLCPYCGETLQPEMPVIGKAKRRRVSAPTVQPAASLPASTAQPGNTMPAAPGSSSGASFASVLDRVGGAIEGLMDRVNSRNNSTAPTNEQEQEQSAPPAQQTTTTTTHAYPRSSTPNGNGKKENPSSTLGGIKPLISREETME